MGLLVKRSHMLGPTPLVHLYTNMRHACATQAWRT